MEKFKITPEKQNAFAKCVARSLRDTQLQHPEYNMSYKEAQSVCKRFLGNWLREND